MTVVSYFYVAIGAAFIVAAALVVTLGVADDVQTHSPTQQLRTLPASFDAASTAPTVRR